MNEWIVNTMTAFGYVGIAALMFLENLFPPIPSEFIMPLAGFTAAQGKLSMMGVIVAGTIGTILGALPWYYAGRLLGVQRLAVYVDRYGKWLGVSGKDITQSNEWFHRHGLKAVFFGRLVPAVRTLISVPAGITNMPMLPFLGFSTIGTVLWVGLLSYAGFFLGENYKNIEPFIDNITKVVVAVVGIAVVVFIAKRLREKKLHNAIKETEQAISNDPMEDGSPKDS
jgi:membrane protein DedA with SNARE-associated domain